MSYRQLVENSPIGIFRTLLSGKVLEGNSALLSALHFKDVDEINRYGLVDLYAETRERERLLSLVQRGLV